MGIRGREEKSVGAVFDILCGLMRGKQMAISRSTIHTALNCIALFCTALSYPQGMIPDLNVNKHKNSTTLGRHILQGFSI